MIKGQPKVVEIIGRTHLDNFRQSDKSTAIRAGKFLKQLGSGGVIRRIATAQRNGGQGFSRLGQWQAGTVVNLERAMRPDGRLDGHMVQGHVDKVGECISVEDVDGSWYYRFRYEPAPEHLLVDKGSVCVNGVSLTVVNPTDDEFSVAIIPYTYEHTNFHQLQPGSQINLEFDIIGKYIARHLALYQGRK